MKQFIDVTAAQIGAVIQYVCANVDFEVVSLPGGSLIAVCCSVLQALYSLSGGFWDAELSGIRVSHRSEMSNDEGVETAGLRCANDHR